MKLRVGLVGLGNAWQTRHQPALRALSDRFEIRAVCEQVAHRAEQVARECGAVAVDGFRAICERQDIDAVIMLSGQWYGALPILAACDAGKALYCAAALDLSLEEAQTLRERVEQAGIAFMAEFPRRNAPATLRLKELIATKLGQPQLLFCHHRSTVEPTTGAGRGDRNTQDRELVELIDWCCYVVDRPATSVVGVRHDSANAAENHEGAAADYRMLSLEFQPGEQQTANTVAQISTGQYMDGDWPEAVTFRPPAALQVACEKGIAFIDLPNTLIWFDRAGRHMESLESERPVGERLLLDFHRAATSLLRKTASLEDAYRAMVIAEAGGRSHSGGQRIALDV
jgi:predicted dehydrogenase